MIEEQVRHFYFEKDEENIEEEETEAPASKEE